MDTSMNDGLDSTYLFHQLDSYPWDEDTEFQGGLSAILGSVQDTEQVNHLTLRAKCYYYARKAGTPVDFDGYKRWVETQRQETVTHDTANAVSSIRDSLPATSDTNKSGDSIIDAPKPATFAQICDMIAEGKPIPGIKDIPDTVLEGQASERQAESRRKPWERQSTAHESPSWMK